MKIILLIIAICLFSSCREWGRQEKKDYVFIEIIYNDGKKETIQYLADIIKDGDGEWEVRWSWLEGGCIKGFYKLNVCNVKSYEVVSAYKEQ